MSDPAKRWNEILEEWKEYQKNILALIKRLEVGSAWSLVERFFAPSPNSGYEDSPEYKAAVSFFQTYDCKEDIEYEDIFVEYARECFDRCEKVDRSHDDKANSIIQYLGGGTALAVLAASFSAKFDTYVGLVMSMVFLLTLLPALVFAILAVSNAIFVRFPQPSTTLPNIKIAVEIIEFFKTKKEIEPRLWLVYHPMVEAAIVRNGQKAVRLHSAHQFYVLAIWSLLLPLVAMFIAGPVAYFTKPEPAIEAKAK